MIPLILGTTFGVQLPSMSDIINGASSTSQGVFTAFLPAGYLEIGITVAVVAFLFLVSIFTFLVPEMLHRKQEGDRHWIVNSWREIPK